MLEIPSREQLMSPVGVLLPENLWPPTPPKAKVLVRTEQGYLDTWRGVRRWACSLFLGLEK